MLSPSEPMALYDLVQGLPRALDPYQRVLNHYTTPHLLTRAFRRLTTRLKIRDLHFHDLRHDVASVLVQAGVNLYDVGVILGHSNPKMTARYAHLAPENLKAAMAALEMAPQRHQVGGQTA